VKYILDTNFVSALMRGDRTAIDALGRANKADVTVPQPVFAEIAYGVSRLPASRRKRRLELRFRLVRGELARAPWTDEVTDRFGDIKATLEREGRRLEDLDLAVAAHALALGGTLVTGNARHLSRVPSLAIVDWLAKERGE
jgi:tRNA(fMet)-specific endonuclease VapC